MYTPFSLQLRSAMPNLFYFSLDYGLSIPRVWLVLLHACMQSRFFCFVSNSFVRDQLLRKLRRGLSLLNTSICIQTIWIRSTALLALTIYWCFWELTPLFLVFKQYMMNNCYAREESLRPLTCLFMTVSEQNWIVIEHTIYSVFTP